MVNELSGKDKLIFNQLAEKLDKVQGDISKLTKEEFEIVSTMEKKYSDKLGQYDMSELDETALDKTALNESDDTELDNSPSEHHSYELLKSGFASFSRQLLARDLKSQFPNEEDAVKFAFQNKWLPQDFKDKNKVEKIFTDYKQDISEANQWREEVVGIESDKSMAVGMTWFMVIYQLNQR